MDYDTFYDKGPIKQIPSDYTKIQYNMIIAVKHDGHHKARSVAGAHLTQMAIESVYSGVVSICCICLIPLIAELNDIEIYQADVRNVSLESYIKETICCSLAKNSSSSVRPCTCCI